MIKITDIDTILRVAKRAIVNAGSYPNCSDMIKRANQFIDDPSSKNAIIFLGALLTLDGENNLPIHTETQIAEVLRMNPWL